MGEFLKKEWKSQTMGESYRRLMNTASEKLPRRAI
jgi:hypothetical protein